MYKNILQANGKIHLKTDSPDLYQFTKTVIDVYQLHLLKNIDDLYSQNNLSDELKIKTHYGSLDIAQSNKVHYLSFIIDKDLPKEKDEQLKEMLRAETI
jgi:tRNA (guanine-N7-)-methyltransferase